MQPAKSASVRPLKRSFTIAGHSTSISLEAPFWEALKEAAAERGQSLAALVEEIDASRGEAGLSSAIRVWILGYYRARRTSGAEDAGAEVPERSGGGH
ncbi:MAG TPA: ribbon-helix-helix domain-containing protein [Hyphomicrobiaceae bacterium]